MGLSRHVYQWDKVVIGSDICSLLYSIVHRLPVIFVKPKPPFRLDFCKENIDLTPFGFSQNHTPSQLELWQRLVFICGLLGLTPMSSNAETIRVKDDLLIITTNNLRVIKASFNKLLVFDPEQIKTLPEVLKTKKEPNRVIDWFNVRYGCLHELEHLSFDNEFVKELYFYPTDRSDNKKLKDAVAVSYLTDKQLKDFDFSEVMARHKVEHLMKEAGIKGPINGYKNDMPVYLSLKIEHAERQVTPNVQKTFMKDEKFKFLNLSLEEILKDFNDSSYVSRLVGVS